MSKSFVKYAFCTILGGFLVSTSVLGQQANNNSNKKTETIYKYNSVPIKQPTMTKSMLPAVSKYNKGDYLGAMLDLKELTEKEPNNTYAKYYLALCYTQLGYKGEAQTTFQNVVDDNSNYALTYYSRRAAVCIENPDDNLCLPPKKVTPPVPKKQEVSDDVSEDDEAKVTVQSDLDEFIQSGRKVHPSAMDKITRERMERKFQADMYARKEAEKNKNEN